jgi:long-chain acyl-CoA synthetase
MQIVVSHIPLHWYTLINNTKLNDSIKVVPSFSRLKEWCNQASIDSENLEDLCNNNEVIQCVLKELQQIGRQENMRREELVRDIRLVPDEWTVENGLLTPALKIKRNKIIEMVRHLLCIRDYNVL